MSDKRGLTNRPRSYTRGPVLATLGPLGNIIQTTVVLCLLKIIGIFGIPSAHGFKVDSALLVVAYDLSGGSYSWCRAARGVNQEHDSARVALVSWMAAVVRPYTGVEDVINSYQTDRKSRIALPETPTCGTMTGSGGLAHCSSRPLIADAAIDAHYPSRPAHDASSRAHQGLHHTCSSTKA